jgi:hypothetical protein
MESATTRGLPNLANGHQSVLGCTAVRCLGRQPARCSLLLSLVSRAGLIASFFGGFTRSVPLLLAHLVNKVFHSDRALRMHLMSVVASVAYKMSTAWRKGRQRPTRADSHLVRVVLGRIIG